MERNLLLNLLTERLSKERLRHSLGVEETAIHLAAMHGLDTQKAGIAGLLHDYGKCLNQESLLKKAAEFGIVIEGVELSNYQLLHGPVGARLLEAELGICDQDVLQAVAKHTTGAKAMSKLDKIIYLADFIEPNRSLPNLEPIRELAKKDLDAALFMVIENTLLYLLKKKVFIDQNTVDLWNSLLGAREGENT